MRWPGEVKMPGVGPHPKDLKAETGGIDPPPEDLGNASEASIVTILWMMSLTMWPWAGNETSPTSSAAIAQLGQLHACPCLQGHPVPNGPVARLSG